jgi:hypothetical protein
VQNFAKSQYSVFGWLSRGGSFSVFSLYKLKGYGEKCAFLVDNGVHFLPYPFCNVCLGVVAGWYRNVTKKVTRVLLI